VRPLRWVVIRYGSDAHCQRASVVSVSPSNFTRQVEQSHQSPSPGDVSDVGSTSKVRRHLPQVCPTATAAGTDEAVESVVIIFPRRSSQDETDDSGSPDEILVLGTSPEKVSALEEGHRLLYQTRPRLALEPILRLRQVSFVRLVMATLWAVGVRSAFSANRHPAIGLGWMMFVEPGSYVRSFG
jgi:hypothetical protein